MGMMGGGAVKTDSLKEPADGRVQNMAPRGVDAPEILDSIRAQPIPLTPSPPAPKPPPALPALSLGDLPAPDEEEYEDAEVDKKAPEIPARPPSSPLPEILTRDQAFSTFSLNVSDVSFKLAAASLERGQMPDPALIRSEEFINAFDYRDPAPSAGAPLSFTWDRARYPFGHNRDLVRFAVQTASRGREPGKPLNLVLLLDNSGSMERADRVHIVREILRVLAVQLEGPDRISVVAFARTPRLWVDGLAGGQPEEFLNRVLTLNPQGGTNLESALRAGYATAQKHFVAQGNNRVILLTDGAANLGNVDPAVLEEQVKAHRQKGIALDGFGIGWEGYNDPLLETLTRGGDGRYGFFNRPAEAAAEFKEQLLGALQVAAANVKVQVQFNPDRVAAYRQVGYVRHQLTKEQFRDDTVDAAEIGAAESGNAVYVIQIQPEGHGPLGMVRVRYQVPFTSSYEELAWTLPYSRRVPTLEQASPALRLAGTAASFAEWLAGSPHASSVSLDQLQAILAGIPEVYAPDPRPQQLAGMIRQARSIVGN